MKPAAHSSLDLSLRQMPQRQLLRAPEDDWTGVIDQQKRRRLQNRLNQRKYRRCDLLWFHIEMLRIDHNPNPRSEPEGQCRTVIVT
jgi:hypothetical protein